MGSLNRVMLIGNLGKDAELRHTPGGSAVANFSIATTEKWTDKGTGQQQERTEWHRVNLWGKVAEALSQCLVKGKQVFVEGSIHTRKWEDRDGNERYSTEVKARNVVLLGGGGRQQGGAQQPGPAPELTEDDIPF